MNEKEKAQDFNVLKHLHKKDHDSDEKNVKRLIYLDVLLFI